MLVPEILSSLTEGLMKKVEKKINEYFQPMGDFNLIN